MMDGSLAEDGKTRPITTTTFRHQKRGGAWHMPAAYR